MIDHMGINVTDIKICKAFYQSVLKTLGYELCMNEPDYASFGILEGDRKSTDPAGDFWISVDVPMTPRIHVAFNAASPDQVDAFFAAGLKAGGTDNGKPGLRPEYHETYYAAFLLDPDGYNIEAVCHKR